jgi:hypothetical protein
MSGPIQMMDFRTLLPLLLPALLISCSEPQPATDTQAEPTKARQVMVDDGADTTQPAAPQEDRSTVPFDEKGPRFTWSIVPAAEGTFGFAIYDRGKLYIDQQKAPGLAGPQGWKNKQDARTAVLAAMEKLEKGEVPVGLNVVGQ